MTHSNPLVASEGSANNKKRKPGPRLSGLCFKSVFVNWLLETKTSFFFFSLIQQCTLSFVPLASDLMDASLTFNGRDAGPATTELCHLAYQFIYGKVDSEL